MKKLFTFLFAVMASISTSFAFTANDEVPTTEPCSTISGTCGKNLSWELTCDGVLTISGTGAMSDWKNASDVPWYSQNKSIKSVVLNDGVTSIGRIAFLNCISLTSVAIPNSVTSIALAAFQGCSALTAVTIPNSVTKIEDNAFYESTGLSSMSVESGNTKYDSRNNCNAIIETASNKLMFGCRNTIIPTGVTSIGGNAFVGCTGLSSINIPNGVTSIGELAFHFCTGLTSITIPSSVTSIGDYAFQYCTGLTSITCEALTPPSGSAMFVVVDKSIPLYVPAESVNAYKANSEWNDFTNILPINNTPTPEPTTGLADGMYVIGAATGFADLDAEGAEKCIMSLAQNEMTMDKRPGLYEKYILLDANKDFSIVKKSGNSYTYYTATLTKRDIITDNEPIPNGYIGTPIEGSQTMQVGAQGLYHVIIDLNTKNDLSSAKLVIVPVSWNIRGAMNGWGCTAGTLTQSGNTLTWTWEKQRLPDLPAEYTFSYGCGWRIMEFDDNEKVQVGIFLYNNPNLSVDESGFYTISLSFQLAASVANSFKYQAVRTGEVPVPDYSNYELELVGTAVADQTGANADPIWAWGNVFSMGKPSSKQGYVYTWVTRNVTLLASGEFKVRNLNWESTDEIERFDIGMYYGGNISVPSDGEYDVVVLINAQTNERECVVGHLQSCGPNLYWIFDSESGRLTIIGSGEMNNFASAEDVPWYQYRAQITHVNLPNELTSIGNRAFFMCSKLTSIVLPNTVTKIGSYAFSACSKLAAITLSNSLTSIGSSAFGGCSSMETIELPSTLTTIGKMAFESCQWSSFTCKAILPPECKDEVFLYVDPNIPLYVPAESVETYKNTDQWKDFTNILPIGGEDPFIPVGTSLTVTEAIAKGKTLEIGAKTTIEYTITGYVSAITDGYDVKNGIQSFWIADENVLANSNEAGALYIYRGKVSKELAFGNKVSVQAYITNYNGMIETYIGGVVTILNDEESVPDLISGICGEEGDGTNLTWQLNTKTGTLEIKGAGKMASLIEKMAGAPENLFWHYFRPYIRKVILPAELTKIGNHAFYQCENLESVVIPDKVDSIGKYAFTGCVKLTQINMPESVRALGANAFYGTNITDPVYNSKIFGYMPKSYEGKYVVPEGIVSIATRSFVNCDKLTEIIMPESLKRLGTDVFDGCGALQSLTCYAVNPPECVHTFTGIDMSIPLYVPAESVDAYMAADGWKDFENILPIEVIPEPNKYIITFLNDDGTKLDQREWEEGETPTCEEPTKEDDDYIYCFKGWNPKIVPVTETATYQAEYEVCGGWLAGGINWRIYKDTLIVSGNGVIPDYEQGAAPWLPFNSRINAIRVAQGITRIGEWAFADMTPIRVQIAQSVTVMGANAFKGSSTIDRVVYDGYDYEWVEINFVNEFSNPLYYGASFNYQVLHINATTKTISTSAFVGFSKVVYHGTLEQWCSMTFTSDYHPSYDLQFDDVVITEICPGEGMTKISAHAFHGCRSIERVCIPISLKQIGQDAFKNMPNLKTVTYAGDLKQWSAITFANSEANPACHADFYFGETKLGTRLDIPDSVTVINAFVFPNTKTLNVYFHHMDPAGYELNSFGEPDQVGDKHFYVPCGTKDAYQKRLNYSEELFEEYFHYNYEVVSADEQKGKVSILHVPTCDEPQLEILATPNQGFRFVEWSDGSTDAQRSLTLESDTVLEAGFDLDSVMIRFLLDDSTLVLEKMFKYGTLPECADPVKEPTAQYTFTFLHWKPEIKVALKDTTYIAVFDSVVNAYMVYFINWNGVLLAEQEVEYGSAAVAPEVPARENYQFVGWNVDINSIVGRTFAVAQFEKEESQGEYTIHYHNTVDDTEIAGETIDLHFPEPPEIEGFVFVGWQAVCDEFIVEGMVIQAVYEPLVPQSAEQVVVNPSNPAQKLFRNGTVYVLRGDKVYTVTGQKVK